MNTENILCGNHWQVPGDRARVRNYTRSNALLGEKNTHITKQAIAQLKCPQDLRDHKLTLMGGDLSRPSAARTQSQFSHRRAGGVSALCSQLTEHPKSQTQPIPLMEQCA